MIFKKDISSLHVPHNKNTAGCEPVKIQTPKEVILPMNMHSGSVAEPIVNVGDHVYVGQLIAREGERFSSPVHATVSGTVTEILSLPTARGRDVAAIRIESDGKMEKDPNLAPPEVHDLDTFLKQHNIPGLYGVDTRELTNRIREYGVVNAMLADKLPVTAMLTIMSFLITVVLSIPLGILAGSVRNPVLDKLVTVVDQFFMSIPAFFVGVLACYIFGIALRVFVPGNFVQPAVDPAGCLRYMIFPAVSIALPRIAMTVKMLRGAILNELGQDYVRTAISRGNDRSAVLRNHVLKNALVPVVTFLATTVAELVADAGVRLYPVGRLDMDSDGLLLLTNDGDLANKLAHPSHEVKKVYLAYVEGAVSAEQMTGMTRPIEIDGKMTSPAEVRKAAFNGFETALEVTIHDGRNRQVRRLCEREGLHVRKLTRVAEGALLLGDLDEGKWRKLTAEEIKYLKN